MATNTSENFITMFNTEEVVKSLVMEVFTTVNGRTKSNMVKDTLQMPKETKDTVNGKKVNSSNILRNLRLINWLLKN